MLGRGPGRIIDGAAEAPLSDDRALLIEEIQSLLALQPGDGALPHVEETLTAGYAHALALEAEQWRLERSLGRIARGLGRDEQADMQELGRLTERLAAVEGELSRLRALLSSLRDRVRALRATAASC
jgi:hypothetical protein